MAMSLMLGSLSLGSGQAAGGGVAPSVALSNSSILDKSATLTKVGTLSGLTGTPTLSDDAGGRFLLRANGANYEICAGLVITDRGGATSHNITVTDSGGAHVLPITVTAITAATLTTAGSIQFPRRNGETAANSIATSVGLYGLFGANVANGEDGAIAFFFDVRRGSLVTTSTDLDINSSPYVLGTSNTTGGRNFACRYFPEDSTTATGTALKGRICFAGKDHSSVSQIGRYVATDTDGTPTGDSTSGSFLRSAVISDDIPRLVVLRYTKSGATWNGNVVPALSMQVITIRLTDFVIEEGDTKTQSAWVGIGTNASKTGALTLGSFTGATQTLANYFPGRLSDMLIVNATGTDTDWQDIAKGVAPSTTFAGSIRYQWTLSGTGDLTQTAGSQVSSSFSVTGTVTSGQQMRPTNVAGAGLLCLQKGAGYTYGLKLGGDTFRTIQQPCVIIGTATHVQARVSRYTLAGAAGDNAIVVDWVRVSSSAVTGAQTFDIPGVPIGWDYAVELRREDDTSVVAINRNRVRVGYKAALLAQSQGTRQMVGDTGPGTATVSIPTVKNLSFAVHRPQMKKARKVDIAVLEVAGDMSYGLLAMMERLGTLAPTVPFMICGHYQSGESLASWYADQVVYSGQTYKAFGDYVTAGDGLVTDMLLTAGKDISFFLHDHGTADSGIYSIYTSLLNALYAGVSDGNEQFSNTPSGGGPTVNPTTIVRSYTGASLDYPIQVVMMPMQRHALVATAAQATLAGYNTFQTNYQGLRKNQAQWTPAGSVTTRVGAYLHDIMLLDSSETAHQTLADVRGNIRSSLRIAMAMLDAVGGLTTYDPGPAISGVVRTSGTVLTVSFTLPNGGALTVGSGGGAPVGFEVSEDSGATWSKYNGAIPFTAAIVGSTVTLTRNSGTWAVASSMRIRYGYGGPIEYFTVSQSAGTRLTNYGLENTDLDNFLYEIRVDAAPSSGSGYVQGVPIIPTFANITPT